MVDQDAAPGEAQPRVGVDVPLVLKTPIKEGRSADQGPIAELMFEEPNLAQLREIERVQRKGLDTDALAETIRQIGHPWGEPERPLTAKQVDRIKASDLTVIGQAIEVFFPDKAEKKTDET